MAELGWEAGVVIPVLFIGLVVMVLDWVAPHLTFTGMVGILMASTVIDTRAGAAGFSNTGVLTVRTRYIYTLLAAYPAPLPLGQGGCHWKIQ
jgi:hypothetical protein